MTTFLLNLKATTQSLPDLIVVPDTTDPFLDTRAESTLSGFSFHFLLLLSSFFHDFLFLSTLGVSKGGFSKGSILSPSQSTKPPAEFSFLPTVLINSYVAVLPQASLLSSRLTSYLTIYHLI